MNRKEEKIPISSLNDIYNFADTLKAKVSEILALQVK